MESADAPEIGFTLRKQVRVAAVPRLLHKDLKSWISWGPCQMKVCLICEWNRDGLWFKARRLWQNMHIRSIFLHKPQKTQRYVIQGNGADPPPPPPPPPHPADMAARDRSDCVCV